MDKAISDLSQKCVLQVLGVIKDADLKGMPPADVLLRVGTSLIGNLILSFISTEISDEERHKACNIFLQAMGGHVKNNFDAMFGINALKAANDSEAGE